MEDMKNSSEVELLSQPPPDRGMGAASIRKMEENAARYRLQSKAREKQLRKDTTVPLTAPGSQDLYFRWSYRFNAFRKHALKHSENDVPDGEAIRRFLETMAKRLKSNPHDEVAIFQQTLVKASELVVLFCQTRFPQTAAA